MIISKKTFPDYEIIIEKYALIVYHNSVDYKAEKESFDFSEDLKNDTWNINFDLYKYEIEFHMEYIQLWEGFKIFVRQKHRMKILPLLLNYMSTKYPDYKVTLTNDYHLLIWKLLTEEEFEIASKYVKDNNIELFEPEI